MIVTFYSYKGGVGRTQLLANIASYLCYYKNKKILLLEWDLEAPGIHFYFGKKNEDIENDGLIEILSKYTEMMQSGEKVSSDKLPYFTDENIIKNLISSENNKGTVDLIPCANYSKEYTQKINDFNWQEFMELLDGKVYIDFLKEKLSELNYDFIFINSRTGISDYSGLCNILIPDTNVIVVAPTEQNFSGSLRIAKAIENHPYVKDGFRKPFILPILSRIDNEMDTDVYEKWISRFEIEFKGFIKYSLHDDYKEFNDILFKEIYIPETTIMYNRKLAIGEKMLFSKKTKSVSELSIEKPFTTISTFLMWLQDYDEIRLSSYINDEIREAYPSFKQATEKIYNIQHISNTNFSMVENDKALNHFLNKKNIFEKKSDVGKLPEIYNALSSIYYSQGKYIEAVEYYKKAIEIREPIYKTSPDNINIADGLATNYGNLGLLLQQINKKEEAVEYYKKATRILEPIYKASPDLFVISEGLGVNYFNYGTLLMDFDADKGKEMIQHAYELAKDTDYSELLSACENFLGITPERESSDSDDIDIPTLVQLIQQLDAKFKEAGEIDREEFKQFAMLHLGLAIKLMEVGETEQAKQVLVQAKEFAGQLEDKELLATIEQVESNIKE